MQEPSRVTDDAPRSRQELRAELERRAIAARHDGHFDQACTWFAQAADLAEDLQDQLNLQIRQACCLLAVERSEEAAQLAAVVAAQARAERYLPELVDALGVVVDHHVRVNRLAEATEVLAEATYVLEQVPTDDASYLVLQNLAVTYTHCGFAEAALDLYDRALRLAASDLDRQFTYANMAATFHYAALRASDAEQRDQYLRDGIYAANAAVDPEGGNEAMAVANALAHRSMMHAETGKYRLALADAQVAYRTALDTGMREEQIISMAGEAMARWGIDHDPAVLSQIEQTIALARAYGLTGYLDPLFATQIDALWSLGRHDEARAALQRYLAEATRQLHDERAARWEHVRLGVHHLRAAATDSHDPLTGLPTRDHLAALLPEMLADPSPVSVGIINLDRFAAVNQGYGQTHGDSVLRQLATLLEHVCRRGDSVVRLGGDEFVLVLRAASPGDARHVFERVRTMIAEHVWDGLPADLRLTASVGVAVGSGAFDSTRVLADAAAALRAAKHDGRDRIAFR